MAEAWRRARVIVGVIAFLSLWVLLFNGGIAAYRDVTWGMRAVFLLGPYAGPFVGLYGPVIGYEADSLGHCLATGIPLLGMIAAHPLRPRWWTGLVSAVGLFVWFLLGLSFIHQAGG